MVRSVFTLLPLHLPRQAAWQDCEVGAIFHFDMPLFAKGGRTNRNAIHQTWDPEIYNPAKLDTDQWVAATKAMGARYAIFTPMHFNGFLQWQSDLYPYGVRQASWRYGPLVQIWFDAGNITPAKGGPDLLPIAGKYQPDMVFYHSPQRSEHRWIGNEAGRAGNPCWATMPGRETAHGTVSHNRPAWKPHLRNGDPDGTVWSPGMADTVLRNHLWCWRPNTENKIRLLEHLVQCYYQSVGHKRIEQFKPTEVAKLRLRITASRAAPMIRQLAAFHSEADPKRPV